LDLLEYEVFPEKETQFELGYDVLRMLTKWCQKTGWVHVVARTQVGLCEDQWAYIPAWALWHDCGIVLWWAMTIPWFSLKSSSTGAIELLHFMFVPVTIVGISGLASECQSHDASSWKVSPNIQRLVAIKLEEIAEHKDELKELRQVWSSRLALAASWWNESLTNG
jgi:hypothetical protein